MPKIGKPPPRRRPGGRGRGRGRYVPRRKVCPFCVNKVKVIDYKDIALLRRLISERGRMEPRRKTGVCARHQRVLSVALKRARHIALLPYTAEHVRQMGGLAPREYAARGPLRRGPAPAAPVPEDATAEVAATEEQAVSEPPPAEETPSPEPVAAEQPSSEAPTSEAAEPEEPEPEEQPS